MRRFSDRHALHTLSELNITPLLDLAFVLLIIFMITTPLMENSVDLVLPTSDATRNPVKADAVQTITIDENSTVALNGQSRSLSSIEQELIALKAKDDDVAVIVRAHRDLVVQQLMNVMDAVQRAQIKRVGVVTTPENP
jgi:biopolymer transport protein ExbD